MHKCSCYMAITLNYLSSKSYIFINKISSLVVLAGMVSPSELHTSCDYCANILECCKRFYKLDLLLFHLLMADIVCFLTLLCFICFTETSTQQWQRANRVSHCYELFVVSLRTVVSKEHVGGMALKWVYGLLGWLCLTKQLPSLDSYLITETHNQLNNVPL